ncbi:Transport and Golgi organization protein 2 [Dillenia turbinata]|uniref:Transport and Golgi organization protein 2 n=1 Tax=Dillenia turbinata TaxID=194707 RepID=A0AAN8VZT1_9MAGN
MCIAIFMWQAHPLYPLLMLQNRDEYHNRQPISSDSVCWVSSITPTRQVSWWENGEILGGRDEVAGGTWLACSRDGRVALVTNVLELHTFPKAKSRGDLPVRFLEGIKSPMEYAQEVMKEAHKYNGFNLILADLSSKSMVYVSNRPKGEPVTIREVSPGMHVLSNAQLDSDWHKAERLRLIFERELGKNGGTEIEAADMAAKLMRDTVKADETRLPHICELDWEYNLSSIFVKVDTPLGSYGTRSTAAITGTANGEVRFYETYLEIETNSWKEHTVSFDITKKKLK